MAKKPKKEEIKYTSEQIEAGLQIIHREYFMSVVGLASFDPQYKELTYIKVPLTTPDGGNYLISILHIDGPKINLQNLAKVADEDKEKT